MTVRCAGTCRRWRLDQYGVLLTKQQPVALEKAKQKKEANKVIESHHKGCLGRKDTCYMTRMKGPGRICQTTFDDIFARMAFLGLRNEKTANKAADLFDGRVIPFLPNLVAVCCAFGRIAGSRFKAIFGTTPIGTTWPSRMWIIPGLGRTACRPEVSATGSIAPSKQVR